MDDRLLTLFSIPKPFDGHIGVIQRNALESWTRLRPACEIVLFGDEPGVAEVARELSLKHVPDVTRNEFGTPLVNSSTKPSGLDAGGCWATSILTSC
jgi:hypothetical protein